MKKLSLFFASMLFMLVAQAQTPYNPFTQNIHFEPEPTAFGFECGTVQTVAFTQGLTTIDNANNWQNAPLEVTVCLTGFTFNTANANMVSGSYASYFNWTIDPSFPNCIQGVQNQPLLGTGSDIFNPNPEASGPIKFSLLVPETAAPGTILAVNVNLQVPGYMSQFNDPADDNESTQTQTYCAIKIKGNVFYDTTLVDNTVNGKAFNDPNDTLVYAHLVGPNGNVLAIAEVAPNGTYEFPNITPNTTYTVVLSIEQGSVGSQPPVPSLPQSWIFVNEDCCDRIGTDNLPNGITTVVVGNSTVLNVNFGIFSPTPTPVSLTYFFVNEQKCKALLTWATAQESNSDRVEILRREGEFGAFSKIATIKTSGNSNQTQVYSYVDESVKTDGTNYQYQLRFVDLDGKLTNSETRTMTINCAGSDASIVNIFPNPSSGDLNVLYVTESENTDLMVNIVDLAGRTLTSKTTALSNGTTLIKMDVSSFAKGTYMLRYNEVDGVNHGSIKFIKD